MKKVDLNHNWYVRYEGLDWGREMNGAVLSKNEGWLNADLPCDIHMPLIQKGIIKEPLEEDNSYGCEWTEDKSWWFRKLFDADRDLIGKDSIELIIESLDGYADIYLNGNYLGQHKSAFYPFTADIRKYIREGSNVLLVRTSSGAEYINDNDLAGIEKCISSEQDAGRGDRGDKRRAFLRKPQFVFGWDWGPRVATCGIVKGAWIEAYDKIAIKSVYARTLKASDNAEIAFETEVLNLHPYSTVDADLSLIVKLGDKTVVELKQEVFLRSGENYIDIKTFIADAELWWPNGMGQQPLYTIKVSACCNGTNTEYPEFKFGIRTLHLCQDKLNQDERSFYFIINGKPVFCKGGNWIPADSVYARVSDDKYGELVNQAKEANFNMLRVWGGGLYERDIFYQKCDENGIMLWHDFMFACALYPDNLEWFNRLVENEMEYQTKRLRNHPSLVLWCGNNENHWAFDEWWNDRERLNKYGGVLFYNKIAPSIVYKNCPHIPYWNSSPYGGEHPNCSNIGDRHHWHDCTMHPVMEKRISPEEYDEINAKFISEYGYVGPLKKSSIIKYHGGRPLDRNGRIWQLHNNTFEKETVAAGINKHYTDPEKLDLDSYLLYAGLCQSLMLGYSLEAIRSKPNCGGALFWMYDDCWGETGWTIIDYYLRRKISYYFVKRAFAPVKLIIREDCGIIKVTGINETSSPIRDEFEYGYVTFNGRDKKTNTCHLELEPGSRNVVFEFQKGENDLTEGIYFVRPTSQNCILPGVLSQGRFRKWKIGNADIKVIDFGREASDIIFKVSSDTYAHGVHFNLDDGINLSDEYFDLLPGEKREIRIYNAPEEFNISSLCPVISKIKG